MAAVLSAGVASAAPMTIESLASDFEARQRTGGTIPEAGPFDPGPSVTAGTLRTGYQTNFQIGSVYFFPLPDVAPTMITGADFAVTRVADSATSAVSPTFNADLVALGFTNTVPPANTAAEGEDYFYIGEGNADAAEGEGGPGVVRAPIQDNFFAPADFIARGGESALSGTDAAGDAALLAYIQSLYANQATNGFVPGTSSLILRLSPDALADTTMGATQRYTTASADNTAAGLPTLTLEVVPEPAGVAMLLIGAFGVLGARRRRV